MPTALNESLNLCCLATHLQSFDKRLIQSAYRDCFRLISYTAISLGWGWSAYPHTFDGANRILCNNIHHHMQLLGDGGAIYTLGAQGGLPFSHIQNASVVLPPSVRAISLSLSCARTLSKSALCVSRRGFSIRRRHTVVAFLHRCARALVYVSLSCRCKRATGSTMLGTAAPPRQIMPALGR